MSKSKSFKNKKRFLVSVIVAVGIVFAASALTPYAPARAQSPVAVSPYSISVFATSPSGLSQPGAVLFANDSVYVAYNNGAALDGSSGSTTVVQYSTAGAVGQMYTIPGGNATVKVEPLTGHIWALQNPVANPSLTVIDPNTNVQNTFTFGPTAHGGGYGDLAFLAGEVYISASNPSANPNTAPAILHVATSGTVANVTAVLAGNATAIDSLTGSMITLNLVSPLTLEFDSVNDLVLNDQADSQLIFVHNPNEADQSVYRTSLNLNSNPVEIGNTAFVSSSSGMLLVSDSGAGTIYAITRAVFSEGNVYTTAPGAVEKVDLDTGDVDAKIVTGLASPSRVAFIPNSEFRLSFSPGGPSVPATGGTVLAIAETNRQGDPGSITITAPNALPKGFKFVTANPLVLSGGTGVVEIKVKGSAGAGVHGIPFVATDSSGRVRRATMLVQVGP
jgi:hypothetical protein